MNALTYVPTPALALEEIRHLSLSTPRHGHVLPQQMMVSHAADIFPVVRR